MKSSPVVRCISVAAVATLLAAVTGCSGDSADLGEAVEVQFRPVTAAALPDTSALTTAPESTSDGVTKEEVHGELGEELLADTEKFVDAVRDLTENGQRPSPRTYEQLGHTEAFAAFGELSPQKVAVLPPDWQYYVPDIGCAQIDAVRAGDSPAGTEVAACDAEATNGEKAKYLLGPAELDSSDVESAEAEADEFNSGYRVALTFTETGAKAWKDLTADNVGEQVAIVADGAVLVAPEVQQAVGGGVAHVTGDYSEAEAEKLASGIEAGTK